MPPSSAKPAPGAARSSAGAARSPARAFLGMLDPVVTEGAAEFSFAGAVPRPAAEAVWTWMVRDVAPDLIDVDVIDDSDVSHAALESLMPELLARARKTLVAAETSV